MSLGGGEGVNGFGFRGLRGCCSGLDHIVLDNEEEGTI